MWLWVCNCVCVCVRELIPISQCRDCFDIREEAVGYGKGAPRPRKKKKKRFLRNHAYRSFGI